MTMTPRIRKLALTAHIISSVGWLGAVTGFLALAIVGLTNNDTQVVRAVYISMEFITQYVIVPFCLASLFTGLVSSLGTDWGLLRHYWILIKLLITVICTIGLLVHMQPISYLAGIASETKLSGPDLNMQIQLMIVASAALLALFVATTLSIYKPRGITLYGWRKQLEKRSRS